MILRLQIWKQLSPNLIYVKDLILYLIDSRKYSFRQWNISIIKYIKHSFWRGRYILDSTVKSQNISFFYLALTPSSLTLIVVTRRNYPPIPQEGDTFQEFTTRENYPPPPLQKNKVNHINKIIMTKLSLMHPCIFSLKKSICAKNLIQLINNNRFTTTCLIFN